MLTSNDIIPQFKNAARKIYGEQLDKIVLFGSRARGDFKNDSDFDFLVVIKDDNLTISKEANKKISDFVYDIWEKTYIRIHALPMSAQKFYSAKTPLLYWIRKEGKEI